MEPHWSKKKKKNNKDCFCFYSFCFHNSRVNQQWTFGLPEANMKSACLFKAYTVFCSYLITLQNEHWLSSLGDPEQQWLSSLNLFISSKLYKIQLSSCIFVRNIGNILQNKAREKNSFQHTNSFFYSECLFYADTESCLYEGISLPRKKTGLLRGKPSDSTYI